MEQIRHYFEQAIQHTISDKEWQFFASKLLRQEFPKKHIILKEGQTEQYLSFIESGIIRCFIPKIKNDLTFSFVFANSFVSAYDSFLTQNPSVYSIQALTQITVWRLNYNELQEIYRETEIGNKIGRFAGENLFLRKIRRELSILNETPQERYQNLFAEQPQLIQHIPLKYIAAYIGLTPQALSRIRKRIY